MNPVDRDAARRMTILAAARDCFLKFGYFKTSFDDIANAANISRPLIYRKYQNKEAILAALFDRMFDARYPAAELALANRGSRRDRLLRIFEIMLLEPWHETTSAPMASEFYEVCGRLLPQYEHKYQRFLLKCATAILGSKDAAEVFLLAVQGQQVDVPSAPVLRRRIATLVERFVAI